MNKPFALDPDQAFEGLTAQQSNYCYWRFQGMSQVEAYRNAYDCEGSAQGTVYGNAWHTEHDPKVVAKLQAMTLERQRQTSLALPLDKVKLRDQIIWDVHEIATDRKNKVKDRLTGYTFLGKIVGIDLFERKVVDDRDKKPATIEDIDKRLAELLGGITLDAVPGITAPERIDDTKTAAGRRRTPAKRRDKAAPGK